MIMTTSLKCNAIAWGMLLTICCTQPAKAETASIQPKPLTAIEFVLDEDHLQQFGTTLSAANLVEKVSANLTEWEFPIQATGPYSHQIKARLGLISRQKTPVGFSFTTGNSDPRAGDFQKADVLPITCTLSDAEHHSVLIERESTFSAHAFDNDKLPDQISKKLIDQISTACLDVLESAPQPKTAGRVKTELFKPKWMPDVRVEVREIPATVDGKGAAQPAAIGDEPKKEVIIHNQGTPVIFKFGFERL
jgi:hypothetical protein